MHAYTNGVENKFIQKRRETTFSVLAKTDNLITMIQ